MAPWPLWLRHAAPCFARSHSVPVTFRPRDFALYLDGNDARDASDASDADEPRPQLVIGTWTVEVILGSTTLVGLGRGLLWIRGLNMDLLGSSCLNRAIKG